MTRQVLGKQTWCYLVEQCRVVVFYFVQVSLFLVILLCAGTASLADQWLLVVPVNVRGVRRGMQTYGATTQVQDSSEKR